MAARFPRPLRRRAATARDIASEATLALLGHSGRAAATALSVVIGVGAFVTASGLTATARASVNAHFERFAAAEVSFADAAPPNLPIEMILSRLLQHLERGELQISWQLTK